MNKHFDHYEYFAKLVGVTAAGQRFGDNARQTGECCAIFNVINRLGIHAIFFRFLMDANGSPNKRTPLDIFDHEMK